MRDPNEIYYIIFGVIVLIFVGLHCLSIRQRWDREDEAEKRLAAAKMEEAEKRRNV